MTPELGREYRDQITGTTGICTAVVYYITGCNQACIQPKSKGTDCPNGHYFDFQRLEATKNKKTVTLDNGKTPGFGQAPPVR